MEAPACQVFMFHEANAQRPSSLAISLSAVVTFRSSESDADSSFPLGRRPFLCLFLPHFCMVFAIQLGWIGVPVSCSLLCPLWFSVVAAVGHSTSAKVCVHDFSQV